MKPKRQGFRPIRIRDLGRFLVVKQFPPFAHLASWDRDPE